jgi:hypothetical protein
VRRICGDRLVRTRMQGPLGHAGTGRHCRATALAEQYTTCDVGARNTSSGARKAVTPPRRKRRRGEDVETMWRSGEDHGAPFLISPTSGHAVQLRRNPFAIINR